MINKPMKKKMLRSWLMILPGLLCFSCSITHQNKTNFQVIHTDEKPQYWELTVCVLNGFSNINLPHNGLGNTDFLNIFSSSGFCRGNSIILKLHSLEQVKQLEDQLMVTEGVFEISVHPVDGQL
jgi:hypothetical protein